MSSVFKKRLCAIIGIFFSVSSLLLFGGAFLFSLFGSLENVYIYEDTLLGLLAWSLLCAFVGIIFYCIDLVRKRKLTDSKRKPLFRRVVSFLTIGSFPVFYFFGGAVSVYVFVWIIYHIVLLCLIAIDVANDACGFLQNRQGESKTI